MKRIIFILLMLVGVAYGQTTGYFRYDTIRMQKGGGNSELIIENATRAVTGGVFTNMGGGRGAFVLPSTSATAWQLLGNAGTTAGTNFIGTTDNIDLVFKRNSTLSGRIANQNTSLGVTTLFSNTTGVNNVAIGDGGVLYYNTSGQSNTGVGSGVLQSGNASYNTAIGSSALGGNTTGTNNIGIGFAAGLYNTTASNQIFINSISRVNYAGDMAESPIYIVQNASVASQRITINGELTLNNASKANGYILSSDASGNATWTNPTSIVTATPTLQQVTGAGNSVEDNGIILKGTTSPIVATGIGLSSAGNGRLDFTQPGAPSGVFLFTSIASSDKIYTWPNASGTVALVGGAGVGTVTGTGTTNELAYWTSSTAIGALAVATYPSLTELSYVKGVTSAIQTQLNTKLSTITVGTTTITSGTTTRVPFNDAGVYNEDAGLTYDKTNDKLTLTTAGGASSGVAISNSNAASYANFGFNSNNSQLFDLGASFSSGGLIGPAFGLISNNANGLLFSAYNATGYIEFLSGGLGTANRTMRMTADNKVGIGTITPNSTLHANGSVATAYRAITALRTLDVTDYTVDCTANTFTVTLPTSVGITGRQYVIVNSGAGIITIATTSSQTFTNVVATPTTLTLSAVGTYIVQATGANWVVLSSN